MEIFNKIYFLEGIYKTKKDLEPIYPKLEEHRDSKYIDYLSIQDDGKVTFGTIPNGQQTSKSFHRITDDKFNGVLVREKNSIYIYREVMLHSVLGLGGGKRIIKQKVSIKDGNYIYIQNENNCFVYRPVN
ncbi:hypothetical protein [Chryseobacterium lacus]|uniref:hypothetical protein n=1 Tax=Chryseobacterium lacus TaxID=2058346 RepID=UPI000F88E2FF|nr:hypothetical protein [Chryseobacterium lacus]RST25854.1 hypothetical protein EIZ46_10720 [Chryseobacterium lacus]